MTLLGWDFQFCGGFSIHECVTVGVLEQRRRLYITFSRVRTLLMTHKSRVTIVEGLVLVVCVCVHVK
jgi:hypothetical protein